MSTKEKIKEIDILKEYKKEFKEIILEEEKEGFSIHLFIYLFVIIATLLYLLVNKMLNENTIKPLAIIFLGWTLAIIIHYYEAFKWYEERLNEKEMKVEEKIKNKLKKHK